MQVYWTIVSIDTYVWDVREELSHCNRGRENGTGGKQERAVPDGHACDAVRTPSLQAIVTSAGRDAAFILRIT